MIENFIKDSNIEYYQDISLKKYNTYRIDTKCKYLFFPKNREELIELIKYLKNNKIKYLVLGNGSNIIFSKEYYDSVIIKLDRLKNMKVLDNIIEVEAGYSLIKLSLDTAKLSLSGLEFASGIPGNIGASIAMNAGAYNHSLGEIVESVEVLDPSYNIITMKKEELNFSYRDSIFKKNKNYIIISAKIKLTKSNTKEILEIIEKRRLRRIETQPLEYPSAGSVFRNPENMHAGALIEECGLKGYSIGGAKVSEKHANFIVNYNEATGDDIINLINHIKEKVYDKYKVKLILEQIIID